MTCMTYALQAYESVDLCPQQQHPLHCFYSNCKFCSMGYEVFLWGVQNQIHSYINVNTYIERKVRDLLNSDNWQPNKNWDNFLITFSANDTFEKKRTKYLHKIIKDVDCIDNYLNLGFKFTYFKIGC